MNKLLSICLIFLSGQMISQNIIDGGFPFQTDNFKKYSIYEPSGYDPSVPQAMILGLHPLNTSRWNAQSWRDTLIQFAETNQLLLVCPDGGPDGRIDDPIDTAFTTVLLDSVAHWYNIDQEEQYVMGFSWGGKTSYTYGLRRTDKFKGYLIIGAAINGVSEIQDIINNARDEAFYLIHGSNDAPNVRYFPLLDALGENGACLESDFLVGVGHTIDFPNRNSILTDAFQWLKEQSCVTSASGELYSEEHTVYPNPNQGQFQLSDLELEDADILIYDASGRLIPFDIHGSTVSLNNNFRGLAWLIVNTGDTQKILKILVQ